MKTRLSTGYFKQARLILLLCFVSSVISAGSALALSGNNINACYDCHGSLNDIRPLDTSPSTATSAYRNISTGAVKGSHRTHITNLPVTVDATTCNVCHGATVSALNHRDGTIQVAPAVAYTKTPFFNQTSVPILGTCSTASCHASSYGSGAVITPTWGNVSGCAACHNSSLGANAAFDATNGAPLTGAHAMHMNAPMACNVCHSNVAKDTNTSSVHINGFINVSGYNPKQVAKHTINTGYGSCTTTLCHGSSSPNWSAVTTNASCTKCHGKKVVLGAYSTVNNWQSAPGYGGTGTDMGGASAATDPQVGAHDVHLRATYAYSARVTCAQCHTVPATSTAAGHTDTAGSAEVPLAGAIARANTAVPTWNTTTDTCSNTYCHYSRPYNSGGVTYTANTAVTWTNTALLTGSPSLAGDCSKCHASPPATTGSHSGVTTISQCNSCHSNVTSTGAFVNPALHVNGILETPSNCSDCHGWPPTTAAHTVHIDNIMAVEGIASLPGGIAGNQVCGVCHNVNSVATHADGSADIFSGTISTLQQSYQFGSNPVTYTKGGTETCSNVECHLGQSTAWGAPAPVAACQSCHGYPPVTTVGDVDNKHPAGATPVNHIGTLAASNTKATFVSVHGGCQICHGTEDSGSGTHAPHANYNVATQHNIAPNNINMNGPVGTGTGYDQTIRGCTAACHGSAAPYRMTTSGKTLTLANYGTGGTCLTCHLSAVSSPVAQGLNAAVTTRVAVTPDFALASRHIRSRTAATAVTTADCVVCHMEGDPATGNMVAGAGRHGDGRINLRDPDTGLNIKGVTHSGTTAAAGAYTSTATDATPIRFSRNLGSATIEADTAAIMVNQCLNCHDSDGALSTTARIPGATAGRPFGAAINANPGSNVLDVASQFASGNRAFHPVLARSNAPYTNAGGTRMVAPWNGVTKTGTAAIYGPLMTCWDCHAPTGSASTVTLTSSGAHGEPLTSPNNTALRGQVFTNSNTATTTATNLCVFCHVTTGNTTNHGTGSGFTSGTDSGMTYLANRCYYCHSTANSTAKPARPIPSGDVHGYTAMDFAGTAFPSATRGYSFFRRSGLPVVVRVGGTGSASCGAGSGICSNSMDGGGYTPGGAY